MAFDDVVELKADLRARDFLLLDSKASGRWLTVRRRYADAGSVAEIGTAINCRTAAWYAVSRDWVPGLVAPVIAVPVP